MTDQDDDYAVVQQVPPSLPTRIRETWARIRGSMSFTDWMMIVITVLMVGSLLRSIIVQEQVEKVQDAAEITTDVAAAARDSADAALQELRAAIRAVEDAGEDEPELQNQAIIDALQAIARIEGFLCGGRCETPG